MYGKPVNLVTSSSIVVRRRGISRKGAISEAEATHLDCPNAEVESSTGEATRNGNDYINFHADNEAKDIIASISLGATRKFLVRHLSYFGKDLTRKRKPLTMPDKKEVI
ncbi:unnamed protein product [Rotaria sp. Silwood1]|nr:unnamed protein product [Rotaria sp. Silwood1]